MWPVSDRYLATLARNHDQLLMIDILKDGVVYATVQNGYAVDPVSGNKLWCTGGSVAVDRQTIRRSCTVTFVDTSGTLVPLTTDDLLAPYITELRIWVGVRYWDAPSTPTNLTVVEWVPVGTFVVTDIADNFPVLTVSGFDRMWLLSAFTAVYTIAAGTAINDAINGIISLSSVSPARVIVNIPQTEFTTPAVTYDVQSSEADAVHTLATVAGWQIFCDPMGTFTVAEESTTDDNAVLSFAPGTASVMLRPSRTVGGGNAGGDMVNAVVFTGENSNAPPVSGFAYDNDPSSLTYALRVGTRPFFESSPLVTTAQQADLAAHTTLRRILGTGVATVVPIVPNHALESGDVIYVEDPDQGIAENFIVDSFTVPLRAADGVQALTCRSHVIT